VSGFGTVLRAAAVTVAVLLILLFAPFGLAQLVEIDLGSYLVWVVAIGLAAIVSGLWIGGGTTGVNPGTGIVMGTVAVYAPFLLWLASSLNGAFA
jgi:hypothetical protein